MDEAACAATMAFGMEAIAGGTDLLCLGEMGIGNTTVAAAIYHGALRRRGAPTGSGAAPGVDDAGLCPQGRGRRARRSRCTGGHLGDPLEVLRRLGGREIAAMAGAILAARIERVPVILDGYVVCAAAAVLHALDPAALDHCIAGHRSAEGAHGEVLRAARQAAAARPRHAARRGHRARRWRPASCEAALACHTGMATFAQAGVADKALSGSGGRSGAPAQAAGVRLGGSARGLSSSVGMSSCGSASMTRSGGRIDDHLGALAHLRAAA